MTSPSSSASDEPPQRDDADAAAEDGAFGVGVERAAMSVGREDLTLLVEIADPVGKLDRDAAGEREIAFAVEQVLRRDVNRDERRRARGLHAEARSRQVEQVRDARRQEVLVVSRVAQQEQPNRADERGVRQQVEHEVAVHPAAAEDADGAGELFGRMTSRLERFPGAFEEVAVLRIENGGFARAEAEEAGVELFESSSGAQART